MRAYILVAFLVAFAFFELTHSAVVESIATEKDNVVVDKEAAAAALLDVDAGTQQINESPRAVRQFYGGGYYGRPYGYGGGFYGRPSVGYYGRPYGGYGGYGGYRGYGGYGGYGAYPGIGFYG